MSTLFSLFVNLFVVPATSKKSEAGGLFLEAAVIVAILGVGAVAALFVVLPVLGLGTATAETLQSAMGQ